MTYIPPIRSWLSRLALCGGLLPTDRRGGTAAGCSFAGCRAATRSPSVGGACRCRGSESRCAAGDADVSEPAITESRATVLSCTPAMRAQAAERFLSDLVDRPTSGPARARPLAGAVMIAVGDTDVFLVPADAIPRWQNVGRDRSQRGRRAASGARRNHRTPQSAADPDRRRPCARGHGGARVTALWADPRQASARGRLAQAADRQLKRLPGSELLDEWHFPARLSYLVTFLSLAVALFLFYSWLTFVLRRFPYTRPWGEALRGFLPIGWRRLVLASSAPSRTCSRCC